MNDAEVAPVMPPVVPLGSLPADRQGLIIAAREARERAHAPYSGFRVGAAVLDASGLVHQGCNVESPSYGLTLCAERVALFAARAAGASAPVAIAVVATTAGGGAAAPCGACRQVILDLCGDIEVYTATPNGDVRIWRAAALLPAAFGDRDLPPPPRTP